MLILGIETSCDETAASVVAETGDEARPWIIRSNVVASQVEIHREWGGVVPELASRQHLRDICGVVERAMADAGAGWTDLGAVAVTEGPGLVGSLLVGIQFAKSVALSLGLPLVGVNHLAGHIESLFLTHGPIPLPAVVLVVSGGHTSLFQVPVPGTYRLIGRTRDDAAGEAYDKVAKLLGLGYPGGPVIDRLAREGDDRAIRLPVPRMTHADRNAPAGTGCGSPLPRALEHRADFSFSGLKTAVRRHVLARGPEALDARKVADLAASFQRVVVESLLDRTFEVAAWFGARSIGVAGGVSANSRLRADLEARGLRADVPVFVPPLSLSTDNAAMIAAAGLRRFRSGVTAGLDLNAAASLAIS
jgi:N6-L-threonylcarbamoyladenine synthase